MEGFLRMPKAIHLHRKTKHLLPPLTIYLAPSIATIGTCILFLHYSSTTCQKLSALSLHAPPNSQKGVHKSCLLFSIPSQAHLLFI